LFSVFIKSSFQFFVVGEYVAVEFWKSRQYAFQKIVAVNAVLADQLHAAVFFAIVEQQAVVVNAVAARMTDNAVYSVGQFFCNFKHHSLYLLSCIMEDFSSLYCIKYTIKRKFGVLRKHSKNEKENTSKVA
jgi:hypothetical protein